MMKNFKNEFVNSKNFYLVMNDGKNFISNHKELLEKRLQTKISFNSYYYSGLQSSRCHERSHPKKWT